MKAIVYTSNTGHTKAYAELMGKEIGLPVYELKEARKVLEAGAPVIYLGWLMAGRVKGYSKAKKQFDVQALCGVGMAKSGTQILDMRKSNALPNELPVFTLQGGFEMDKLHGVYKMMMNTMKKTAGKGLQQKQNRTPDEEEMLQLLMHGGDKVDAENLKVFLDWYRG